MKFFYLHLALLASVVLFSCTSKSARKHKNKHESNNNNEYILSGRNDQYKVKKVVDGDTFWVDNHTEQGLKVRLIGIDAPESRNAFKKKKQVYGQESKQYALNLLQNQSVRLEFDVDSLDQYGRTLAYAYLENGDMVNELLVKSGNAIVLTITPNVKYEKKLYVAQQYAREQSLGLWSVGIK